MKEHRHNGTAKTGCKPDPERATILVVDDDPMMRRLLRHTLERTGFEVIEAGNGREALDRVRDDVMVVLLDLQMPVMDGHDCQERLREAHPHIQVIIVTAVDEVKDAVAAMKRGAFDYITKPFNMDRMIELVEKSIRTARLSRENRQLRQSLTLPEPQNPFIGNSGGASQILSRIEKIGQLDSTVLITGESGVGKGLVARTIHYGGPRRNAPFVTVNCTAMPRDLVESELFGHEKGAFTGAIERRLGRVEMADGGTLFLDEIGDMPLDLQPKLLTFLQERTFQRIGGNQDIKVNVRVIAATHQNLKALVEQKRFREDLYFRLNVLPLRIPPLRERTDDIPTLAEFLLERIGRQRGVHRYTIDAAAMKRLITYPWPGNVRELENVLERASAFCESRTIRAEDLPLDLIDARPTTENKTPASLAGQPLAEIERQAIEQTLAYCGGNKAQAARVLGISEKSIYNKMRRLHLPSRELVGIGD